MRIEEISFINDVIQDNRANARIEKAYDLLIGNIFNNCKLNWNDDGLILKSDEKLFTLLEVLEPKLYDKALKDLKHTKELEEKKNLEKV